MRLLLVTAMAVEAQPVVRRLKLQAAKPSPVAEGEYPFRLYQQGETALVVSGMGKASAAAATAWAASRLEGSGPFAFLNFGSAGHRHRPVGEALLAQEVRDRGSGRRWFPPLVFDLPCATAPVITVDRIETSFEDDGLYEMEASGFLETALRFTSAELVQCLKFVSDNTSEPVANLGLERIGELAEQSLDTLEAVMAEIETLALVVESSRAVPPHEELGDAGLRFSVTQQRQLRRLQERWQALRGDEPIPQEIFSGARGRKEALSALKRAVEEAARSGGAGP